jgi:protease-4
VDNLQQGNTGGPRYYPPPPPPPPKRRSGLLWVMATAVLAPIVSALAFLFIVGVIIGALSGTNAPTDAGVDDNPVLREVWSCGKGTVKVARIALNGVLIRQEEGGLFGNSDPIATALRHIRAATVDDTISGIILEIDSPGGGITACDMIYEALLQFKKSADGRVVVAIFGDVAASGGYYVAASADRIIAHPTTVTGSIGVIISALNVKGFGEKYGVKMETIKSGANKDLLNPFGTMTEEQRVILQQVVDEMHERFVQLIADGRPDMTIDDVRAIADGRIMTANRAKDAGLVDEVGYWNDALSQTRELLGVTGLKVVRYEDELSLSSLLRVSSGRAPVGLSLSTILDLARLRAMYLWQG